MPDDDQRRFDTLVRDHRADLYRFAYYLSRSAERAEDLVQDTLLRAWRFLHQLRDAAAAKGWLMATLRREYARGFERKRFDTTELSEVEISDAMAPSSADLADAERVREAMLRLDDRYRVPLLMQVLGGSSCAEIAEELGISEAAVMTQVFRARQKLRQVLAPERGGAAHGRP